MKVVAYLEKKENENSGKREVGEEEKIQLTDFRQTGCCPSAVV